MTRLSVNINKVATLRNARGGNNPDVLKVAQDCERFGAQGITVHPRPDERHIRYSDVRALKSLLTTEFNIEGNPEHLPFVELVTQVKPHQVTLVPDGRHVITSNAGWDTIANQSFLTEIVTEFKKNGIRVSIFVNPIEEMIEGAAKTGADRIELYTEPYARQFLHNRQQAIAPYVRCAHLAKELGLGVNAGHDLDLNNLAFLKQSIPFLEEVSIGHALICDALYYGLENTIRLYRRQLETQPLYAHTNCPHDFPTR
ncbi:MAG: pyridoxine 5'-phosphate synthase [Cytophagales bacterium]|nr:pyridoxine 5'-phosphate synthase [Bernardetiaceae bacterium]MDW8210974.1 pyridoxine 5'-phosphate synthase [Cytophagales bacterium]